jgi:ABC-type dipeptide/oligopeptide/nickel transport system ATPase component
MVGNAVPVNFAKHLAQKIIEDLEPNMKNLKIKLEHCYGVKKLEHTFEFTEENKVFAVYAQNGCMKTSFAKTFQDFMNNQVSKDNVFPNRKTIREILFDNKDISPETIFVIDPYNKKDYESEKMSTLLASKELKKQYDNIHKNIDTIKNQLFNELRQLSGKKDKNTQLEDYISSVFKCDNFYDVISKWKDQLSEKGSSDFCDINYNTIFNDKVKNLLEQDTIKNNLKEYINKYNELTKQSKILNEDFKFHNADNLIKPLEDNNFFNAKHSINLFNNNNNDNEKIENIDDLKEVLEVEKNKIFNNEDLKKIFDTLNKEIKNNDLRNFREHIQKHPEILPELDNIVEFKKNVWLAYFTKYKDLSLKLVTEYEAGQEKINSIIEKAEQEQTSWKKVVKKFKQRFVDLPFKLRINNKEDVILKDKIPEIEFIFEDREGKSKNKTKDELLNILSTGETRALYILNIIFEVEARKQNNEETLFIIDDIADSFDYKNKYAIIEYLKEISEINNFYMIILTHNFDFFRTLESRGVSPYNSCLIAIKNNENENIELQQFEGLKNPFINNWITNLTDNKKLIASIPFVRNLIEYIKNTKDKKDKDYSRLTSLLHIKNDTKDITLNNIKEIFIKTFSSYDLEFSNHEENTLVLYLIFDTANKCLGNSEGINLEQKIVLSIAIRLKAEEFMINKINDTNFCNQIKNNQTSKLLKEYKNKFSNETETIKLLEKVVLMTPIQIHINSFMYEPLIDMGYSELTKLYKEVKDKLNDNVEYNKLQEQHFNCNKDKYYETNDSL